MRSIQQQVIDVLQTLSPIEQQEVLNFVEHLQRKQHSNQQEQAELAEQPVFAATSKEKENSSPHPSPAQILETIAALPLEGKTDAFSGQDHDQILYSKSS